MKLMFLSGSSLVSLYAYGKTLLNLADVEGSEVTEDMLLEVPVFTSVDYNSQNVILLIGFVPSV